MEKSKTEKIITSVVLIAAAVFGFWVLSLGFRIIWEAVKAIF